MKTPYESLVEDTLTLLTEESTLHKSLIVSQESHAFFSRVQGEKKNRETLKKKEPEKTFKSDDLEKHIANILPHLKISSEIPSDEQAVRIANAWQEQENVPAVAILCFSEHPKEQQFLSQVATAITSYFLPARVIDGLRLEKEKKWDLFLTTPVLRLIIAHQYPKTFYRENLASSEKFLDEKPLFLISPPSFYFQNPEAKRTLWKKLCTTLQSS